MAAIDTRFIEYCINDGLFSLAQAQNAQKYVSENTSIYVALVQSNAVTQEQLAIAAGDYYDTPVVNLAQVTPEPNALRYVTQQICKKYNFLPFAVDPVAGLLVSVVDYCNIEAVRAFLQGQRVERMNFYIGPCNTLNRLIDANANNFQQLDRTVSPTDVRRKNLSIRSTQYLSIEDSFLNQQAVAQPSVPQRDSAQRDTAVQLEKLKTKITSLKEENLQLRQQLEKVMRMLELETKLTRDLTLTLKNSGVLSQASFDRILSQNF